MNDAGKSRMRLGVAAGLLAALPLLATAGARGDYARQWPLVLPDSDAGAYRVMLGREVYRSATQPRLDDVEVFDAGGDPVPAALFQPDAPLADAPALQDLPWFPLPPGAAARGGDITLISERDADGAIRRVEAHVDATTAKSPARANAWLVDASRMRVPLMALQLAWQTQSGPLDVDVRVEGSDDLREWRTLQPHAQLLDLARDGRRLRQARIPLEGSARYLRLVVLRPDAELPLSAVRAETARAAVARDWRWETLHGRAVAEAGASHYDFALEGRFPVARADIAIDGNAAGEWTLASRDDPDAPWTVRAGPWVAFALGGAAGSERSPPQDLAGIVRDRYWRLTPRSSAAGVPTLRLGYRPEVLVFLARGNAPFALAAGSARARRADAPLQPMLDALRTQRGAEWRPAAVTLGAVESLAGDRALAPKRDWRTWMLWGVLVLGAVLVAGFAFRLLRERT